MIASAIDSLLSALAVPDIGLLSVFIMGLLSATLLPLGSEPTVFAVIKANGALFWPVILVASVGNTLGGTINYWIGFGAKRVLAEERSSRWFGWLQRFGAKTMLLAWLPVIGDPLCVLAGWLKLPFWPCLAYMAIGKALRYVAITWLLFRVPEGFWHRMVNWL